MTIFLDLDDVLADFSGGLNKQGIKNRTDFIHKPKTEWTPEDKELDQAVISVMRQPGFFYSLNPCHGAFLLYESCRHLNPWILTARPSERVSGNRVTSEKFKWVSEYFGEEQAKRFICCLRSEKAQYATSEDDEGDDGGRTISNILVDDLPANISAWQDAGGIGVHHEGNMNETIKKLRKAIGS